MTQRWWDEPARPSRADAGRRRTPDFGRRPPRRKPFNPWVESLVAYGIQMAVASGVLFAVLTVGLFLALLMGAAGVDLTERQVLALLVVAALGARTYSLFVQARYLTKQGASEAFSAFVIAFISVSVVAGLVALAGLPTLGTGVVGAVLEIVVVAVLINPGRTTTRESSAGVH